MILTWIGRRLLRDDLEEVFIVWVLITHLVMLRLMQVPVLLHRFYFIVSLAIKIADLFAEDLFVLSILVSTVFCPGKKFLGYF